MMYGCALVGIHIYAKANEKEDVNTTYAVMAMMTITFAGDHTDSSNHYIVLPRLPFSCFVTVVSVFSFFFFLPFIRSASRSALLKWCALTAQMNKSKSFSFLFLFSFVSFFCSLFLS